MSEREMRTDLWATVKDDKIVSIGPFPYFVEDERGFKFQMRGQYDPHRRADRQKLEQTFGLKPVYSENRKHQYDTDLISEVSPTDYVEDSTPIRKHNYEFTSDVREKMVNKINVKAERERMDITPSFGGQIEEYREAERQAQAFNKLSKEKKSNAKVEDWPALAASLKIDVDSEGQTVTMLQQAAHLILQTVSEWRDHLNTIRWYRKQTVHQIRTAQDDEQAYQIYLEGFKRFDSAVCGMFEQQRVL